MEFEIYLGLVTIVIMLAQFGMQIYNSPKRRKKQ